MSPNFSTAEQTDHVGSTYGPTADEVPGQEAESVELPKDDLFHILQNQRRRRVLQYLQSNADEPQVDMRDIAEQVAAWENDTTLQQLTSKERQRVYIALYQSHLPKLDEKGIVNYNQSRGVVERTPLADQFEHYLQLSVDTDEAGGESERWAKAGNSELADEGSAANSVQYYGGATALGVTLTAASWVGVAPTALSSYLATFLTGMFLFVTVGIAYQNRN